MFGRIEGIFVFLGLRGWLSGFGIFIGCRLGFGIFSLYVFGFVLFIVRMFGNCSNWF